MGRELRKMQRKVARADANRAWIRRWDPEDSEEDAALSFGTHAETMLDGNAPVDYVLGAMMRAASLVAREEGKSLGDLVFLLGKQWERTGAKP